jgi:long-subunit acyl-CoA synthetase (AMP-forming)
VTLLSILANHAIAVPLAPAFPARELQHILADSSAAVLVSSMDLMEHAVRAAEDLPRKPVIAPVERQLSSAPSSAAAADSGASPFLEEEREEEKAKERNGVTMAPSASALMLYTSGTTGRPVRVATSPFTTGHIPGVSWVLFRREPKSL